MKSNLSVIDLNREGKAEQETKGIGDSLKKRSPTPPTVLLASLIAALFAYLRESLSSRACRIGENIALVDPPHVISHSVQ